MDETDESGALKLCTKCIGRRRYVRWIQANGKKGQCDFDASHGRLRKAVSVASFAEEVDGWFRENYQKGEEYAYFSQHSDNPSYTTHGDPYKEILSWELECDEPVLDAIAENLPDESQRAIQKGAEAFYDDSANYESTASVERRSREEEEYYWYQRRFSLQWNEFCDLVQYKNRFFNIKRKLDKLFGKPAEYNAGDIKPIYILKAGQPIFRARLLDDQFTEDVLMRDPAKELGAPPVNATRAGRMNVEFIPVFYGAFSEQTAIAEIRPSIGDHVAVGQFTLLRDLNVFDFTAFSRARGSGHSEIYAHTRYEFVTQLEDEISKPILPFEKQKEYIATQIVAEYLREFFKCDAVIYQSSMHKGKDGIDNRNIVILNRGASFVGTGEGHVLSIARPVVKEVTDVIFTTQSSPFQAFPGLLAI